MYLISSMMRKCLNRQACTWYCYSVIYLYIVWFQFYGLASTEATLPLLELTGSEAMLSSLGLISTGTTTPYLFAWCVSVVNHAKMTALLCLHLLPNLWSLHWFCIGSRVLLFLCCPSYLYEQLEIWPLFYRNALVCSHDHLTLFLTLVSGLEFIRFDLELVCFFTLLPIPKLDWLFNMFYVLMTYLFIMRKNTNLVQGWTNS